MVQPCDELDISIFEAMQVCHVWQRIILDLLCDNTLATSAGKVDEGRLKRVRSFEEHCRARHEPWIFDRSKQGLWLLGTSRGDSQAGMTESVPSEIVIERVPNEELDCTTAEE